MSESSPAEVVRGIFVALKTFGDEMKPLQFLRLPLTEAHKKSLKSMAYVAGLNETSFQVTITFEGLEGDHAGERYRGVFLVGDPPETVAEVPVL